MSANVSNEELDVAGETLNLEEEISSSATHLKEEAVELGKDAVVGGIATPVVGFSVQGILTAFVPTAMSNGWWIAPYIQSASMVSIATPLAVVGVAGGAGYYAVQKYKSKDSIEKKENNLN